MELWNKITGIIPWCREEFGIGDVRIQAALQLGRDLSVGRFYARAGAKAPTADETLGLGPADCQARNPRLGATMKAAVLAAGGVAVDLGCGSGWYIRKLVARFPHVRGIGLDGFEENVRQAAAAAEREGLSARLSFRDGERIVYASLPATKMWLADNKWQTAKAFAI